MSIPYVLASIAPDADNETWTITAITPTTFSVVGSRSGDKGIAVAGVQSTHGAIEILITNGTYTVGDSTEINVHAPAAPRYIKKLNDGTIVNADPSTEQGTWLTPRRMFENVNKTFENEISFPNMIDHFRSVIKSQTGFSGSSFGTNNFRNLTNVDVGFGGTIREYNGNFPLLASMLMQKGISPLSIIDFAEHEYVLALSSIDQFLVNDLANFFAEQEAITLTTINTSDPSIQTLLARFEELRANDVHLKEVFGDSTAAIKNWPVSLVNMCMVQAVDPTIQFDNNLGIDVVIHHDGHHSPVLGTDFQFDQTLALTKVTRSDGLQTQGSNQELQPTAPYARQLWFKPSTGELKIFNVTYDMPSTAPNGVPGEFWYRRGANELREWDDASSQWIFSGASVASRWQLVNTTIIRNSLLLAVEEKLYANVHSAVAPTINLQQYDAQNEYELAKYAAKYGFDTYAPDYNAADAFSWNYKQATLPGVAAHTARWQDIYLDYFDQPGVSLATCRPNLEPWKLLNFASKPAGWDASYKDTTNTRLWKTTMWTYIQSQRPGMKICVDPTNDTLLPPYVSSASANAAYALTNTIPTAPDAVYVYGDHGPVEIVWRSSVEYLYGCARTYFRQNPMNFLDKVWGYTYIQSAPDTIRLERNLMRPIGAKDFKLHGEKLVTVVQRNPLDHIKNPAGITTTTAGVVKLKCVHVKDNVTYFDLYVNGNLIGYVTEGANFSAGPINGITFTNVQIDDMGIAFNLGDEFVLNVTP
jgi:hypothetical protein